MVDALVSGTSVLRDVGVRIPPSARMLLKESKKLKMNNKPITIVLQSFILTVLLFASSLAENTALPSEINREINMDAKIDHLTIPFNTIKGEPSNLAHFGDKVILIVNVASKCGFTPQYKGLEALYRNYKDRGLVIIGFPANNFGKQEPGSDEEIMAFCQSKYEISFPMMSKISVLGEDIHPIYSWLTVGSAFPGDINWNFNKFLLDRQGNIAERFGPKTKPSNKKLVVKIEELLGNTD